MKCVKCKKDTRVAESRPRNNTVWRRRKCNSCDTQFRTIEILEPVVKPKAESLPEAPRPKSKTRWSFKRPKQQDVLLDLDMESMTDEELEAAIYGGEHNG